MTEHHDSGDTGGLPVLREISRKAGHELRNALNSLLVNLEVVRSRGERLDDAVRPFVTQAVDQAEESVRIAEGTIALLNLVVNAVGPDGKLGLQYVSPRGAAIRASEGEALRATRALQYLATRAGGSVETGDAAVILSIPVNARESKESND